MAAANFSRDVNENVGDLIDFETIIEDPRLKTQHINEVKYPAAPNYCRWYKVGKYDVCGKSCKEKFCGTHLRLIRKGATILTTCFGCGVGITRWHYLCTYCEK